MVRPERFERPTYWFVASCSIQLSYGRTFYNLQPDRSQLSKFSGFRAQEQPAPTPRKHSLTSMLQRQVMMSPENIVTDEPSTGGAEKHV